jgi:hypothetical protein
MTTRHYIIYLCLGAHLSNTRVLVGKPFQYKAPVTATSHLSTTMTTGTNFPIPPPILKVRH